MLRRLQTYSQYPQEGRGIVRTHQEHFVSRYYEMGSDQLLRVQCLCNYMEEAAGMHADSLGVGLGSLAEKSLAWVLAKMRLMLRRRPGPRETLRVETWPVGIDKLQFRRDFMLYDASENVLATAVTQWVVINTATRRLERFPAHIQALQPDNPPLAQESGDIRVPALSAAAAAGPLFPVRLADIDQNMHVHNGRYIDFVLEAADATGFAGELAQLDIIFRAEGVHGDEIGSKTLSGETAGSAIHSLYRTADGTELARARTVFR